MEWNVEMPIKQKKTLLVCIFRIGLLCKMLTIMRRIRYLWQDKASRRKPIEIFV